MHRGHKVTPGSQKRLDVPHKLVQGKRNGRRKERTGLSTVSWQDIFMVYASTPTLGCLGKVHHMHTDMCINERFPEIRDA